MRFLKFVSEYVCHLHSQEISVLQINTASQVKLLETDLQATKAAVKMLTDRNKDLGKTSQSGRGITVFIFVFLHELDR